MSLDIFFILTAIQALITCIIVWPNKKTDSEDYYLLLFLAAILFKVVSKYILWISGNYILFYKLRDSSSLLYGPLLLFYYQRIKGQPIPLRTALLHCLPFVALFLIQVLVYVLSMRQNNSLINWYSQLSAVVCLSSPALYSGYVLWQIQSNPAEWAFHHTKRTIIYILGFSQLTCVLIIIFFDFILVNSMLGRYTVYATMLAAVVLVLYFRVKLFKQHSESFEYKVDQHTEKPGKLDESQLEEYIPKSLVSVYDRQIREFMESQKAFLQRGYTLREMAETTGIPLHHLSAVINRHYGYHFNEYINHWRIEYLKQRLDKNEWKHKTLEALAQESGFTNRTSFITAFKKHCGKTPSDYIRTIKGTV
ncbi:hypothetical protein AWR27_23405 [Spirosoma montaniterrae]|uniref:HTH araC/xylS-type domain-containing protein n=1 Tax=Spirosoma montaniterrae TaxID=1178516 RepID=A0A1P9X2Z8_9BACT|nr:hypothetical protein AWR27_23405 [Spirosoma montaniterrae]